MRPRAMTFEQSGPSNPLFLNITELSGNWQLRCHIGKKISQPAFDLLRHRQAAQIVSIKNSQKRYSMVDKSYSMYAALFFPFSYLPTRKEHTFLIRCRTISRSITKHITIVFISFYRQFIPRVEPLEF